MDASSPIDEAPASRKEVSETAVRLKRRKAAGVCNIIAEVHNAGGEVMTCKLHTVTTAVYKCGTIRLDCKRVMIVSIFFFFLFA